MKKIERLTDLEIKIMKVLWEHSHNLTIQEMAKYLEHEKISSGSITQSIKHLISKKAVEVCEHVLVASVYARTFKPNFSQEEYLASEFERMQKSIFGKKKKSFSLAASLLSNSEGEDVKVEEVEKLQKYIDAKMEQLRNEGK